jgi:glucose/arabinose dehydrogenase
MRRKCGLPPVPQSWTLEGPIQVPVLRGARHAPALLAFRRCSMAPRVGILLALVAAALLPAAALYAQDEGGPPPGNEAAARLKPLVPPAEPTPAGQLPLDRLKLPKGFHMEVYASGIAHARSLRVGKHDTVFVGSTGDKVSAIVDQDGKRQVKVIASGLTRPNGLAYHDGTLYIAEPSRISKIDMIEDVLDNPPAPTVIYSDLPNEPHSARYIGIGPDSKLYVSVDMPCNNCVPGPGEGQIRRIDLSGGDAEAVALGVRNSLGFDWSPRNKDLYFTDNGRDWLSEDAPSDELNRVGKPGENFGAPYCYAHLADPQFGWGRSCDEFTGPTALLGPHVAPLGLRFYIGRMFPRRYRDALFVARHGSWNRTRKIGGDVMVLHLNKEGSVQSMEPFLTGFLDGNNFLGRPVDVQPMRDGSLLISDDWNGAVYRVTYGSARAQREERHHRRRRHYRRRRDFFFDY